MIYCTLFNPSLNIVYTVDSFVSGNTLHGTPCVMYPAGTGINVAHVARILEEEVSVVGILPERDRPRFVSYLENKDIGHHFFLVPGNPRVNVTVIERDDRTASRINGADDQEAPLHTADEFLRYVSAHAAHGDVWCFTGSLPKGFDDDAYAAMIRQCTNARCDAFLDTSGKPLRLGVRAKPMVLKPNIAELEDLFGEQIKGVHHIALKGKKLLDMGIVYVFISLGADGMIALHDNDCMLCVPPQVKSVDTAGCGDALMAGILVAWKRNFSFPEMCRLAVACGVSKALHEGPQTVTRDEIWQLMEDVHITAI